MINRTIKSPPKPRPSLLQDIKEAVKKAPPKRATKNKYKDWTRYHIVYTPRHQWKFYHEGMKRSIRTASDRDEVINEALYRVANTGGLLTVHYKDGTVDFIVDNWIG